MSLSWASTDTQIKPMDVMVKRSTELVVSDFAGALN